ncbi:hypothetical protein CF168_04905 [Shewanella bicestrii]|uniref:Uncharacterized protein n=1 Tax=Shewanella bicestrii TaxID=2018305 RepID=A0A220UJC0_9GAMM|nr:hypothetical protein [Shewanella bicestrii]ASK68267.1 hypothetical protein CF168_04905 [Shewanella bicestrii]
MEAAKAWRKSGRDRVALCGEFIFAKQVSSVDKIAHKTSDFCWQKWLTKLAKNYLYLKNNSSDRLLSVDAAA